MKTCAIAALVLVTCLPGLEARTYQMTDEKFSLELPDPWVVTTKPGVLFSAAAPRNGDPTLIIIGLRNDLKQTVSDPVFVSGLKQGMEQTAAQQDVTLTFLNESAISLNDVPAYTIQYREDLHGGKIIFVRAYAVAANGKVYLFSLQTLDSSQDYQLQNIANSLHFSPPPVLPGSPGRSIFSVSSSPWPSRSLACSCSGPW